MLCATDCGKLTIANLTVDAYLFHDEELANNLLGIQPFSNLGCTAIFHPHWFGIYPSQETTPIVVGTRDAADALWTIDLAPLVTHKTRSFATHEAPVSDGIPPPSPSNSGVFIKANAIDLHDNAGYVKFVHASLGYPAPSTFLRAVTAGWVHNGTQPVPSLNAKNGS
jgi:hypothetical protein